MKFSDITVVNVDGRLGDLPGQQLAIARSADELPGARRLLLSPRRPDHLLDGIEHRLIQPLGYFEYGLFILYALHHFVETEFALVVQDDGWVLSGANWRPEFWDCDFIGAPSHLARVTIDGGARFIRRFHWVDLLQVANAQVDIVLNGGFSLRSRKLLQALANNAIPYVLPPMTSVVGPPYRMHWDSDSQFEDVYLCVNVRNELEQLGIRFAPLPLALMFSFERLAPGLHDGVNLMEVFGHHSVIRRLGGTHPRQVRYLIKESEVAEVHGEADVLRMLRSRGYDVVFRA